MKHKIKSDMKVEKIIKTDTEEYRVELEYGNTFSVLREELSVRIERRDRGKRKWKCFINRDDVDYRRLDSNGRAEYEKMEMMKIPGIGECVDELKKAICDRIMSSDEITIKTY